MDNLDKSHIIILLLIGVAFAVASIVLRVRSNGENEVKSIDLVFVVVPLLFAGLATGKIQGLDFFGVKADFSQLWADAADTGIEKQISAAPVSHLEDLVEMIDPALKAGVDQIPNLIEEKAEALSFRLGTGRYLGSAIETYFNNLLSASYLRFVVINDADGTLFGMYAAGDIVGYLQALGDSGYEQFAGRLNTGDEAAKTWLAELPGFVAASAAVTIQTSKREALKDMETRDRDNLPVVDASNNFVGTVERAKLTASLILEVTENISSE